MIQHDYWLERVQSLRVNPNPAPAPHKPLLLLFVLSRLKDQLEAARTLTGLERVALHWQDVHWELDKLLHDHTDRRGCMLDPFWRLQTDDLWIVDGDARPASHADAEKAQAVGRLDPAFERALVTDPSLLEECVEQLLGLSFEGRPAFEIRRTLGL